MLYNKQHAYTYMQHILKLQCLLTPHLSNYGTSSHIVRDKLEMELGYIRSRAPRGGWSGLAAEDKFIQNLSIKSSWQSQIYYLLISVSFTPDLSNYGISSHIVGYKFEVESCYITSSTPRGGWSGQRRKERQRYSKSATISQIHARTILNTEIQCKILTTIYYTTSFDTYEYFPYYYQN